VVGGKTRELTSTIEVGPLADHPDGLKVDARAFSGM
jgi:hypothetical protein